MTLATEIVQNYRLALRTLWNTHYWSNPAYRDYQSVRDFEKAELLLFRGLVARRLEPLALHSDEIFGSSFRIVPAFRTQQIAVIIVAERIGDTPNFKWDEVSGPFTAKQLKLTLLNFFDWEIENWRDFRYFRVRIQAFEDKPQFIGCDALVEVLHADVLWNVSDEAMVSLGLGAGEASPPAADS